jgi:hypothetical protein
MNNTIELVIITFKYDIPQLYLLLLSIKKYLSKDIHIRIIFNYVDQDQKESLPDVLSLVNEHLKEFSFEIIKKPKKISSSGWISQQILKWYAAYTSTRPWQLVIDSKNFFIREFDFSTIDFDNNKIPGFYIESNNDTWSLSELERSFNFVKKHQPVPPQRYAAMTPWIWNTDMIKEMLDTMWPNNVWEQLIELPGTEWFLYLSWVSGKIEYFPKQVVTGIWGIQNSADHAYNGISNHNIYFWTKHRFAIDSRSIFITEQVLKEFNVATDKEIKTWKKLIKTGS